MCVLKILSILKKKKKKNYKVNCASTFFLIEKLFRAFMIFIRAIKRCLQSFENCCFSPFKAKFLHLEQAENLSFLPHQDFIFGLKEA